VRLRPDHVIWLLKYLYRRDGNDPERQHGGRKVLESLTADLDQPVQLVLGVDDICEPCKYNHDGRCTDGLSWTPKITKQEWVERRDAVAMRLLQLSPPATMSARKLFALFEQRLPLLAALQPEYHDYEPGCLKGRRDQALYAEGLRRVCQHTD